MNRMGTVEDNTKENVGGKKKKTFFLLKTQEGLCLCLGGFHCCLDTNTHYK